MRPSLDVFRRHREDRRQDQRTDPCGSEQPRAQTPTGSGLVLLLDLIEMTEVHEDRLRRGAVVSHESNTDSNSRPRPLRQLSGSVVYPVRANSCRAFQRVSSSSSSGWLSATMPPPLK